MKAIQISRFGGPEVLEPAEVARPLPDPGQALIRVGAAGVNFFETLQRQDRYGGTPTLPMIPGVEVAGTVEALGAGVDTVRIGERVAAPLFAAGNFSGGYADYVAVNANWLVPLPDELPFARAAALMVQGLTALHLVRQAPPAGKSVLVSAAAGGVGSLLVQIAGRASATRVIAAASSAEKLAVARRLGAEEGVDYSQPGWTGQARAIAGGTGFDIIYESTGGTVMSACLGLLAPLGRIVAFGALNLQDFALGLPELKALVAGNQSLAGFTLLPLLRQDEVKADLAELFGLAARGEIEVLPGGSYPLEQAKAAHQALESRQTTGKLVLIP
ncbi:zinc-binding dehydrogenase [Bosea sp. BK604]|uniref:quinone oxidoreductase family protein n=1 Tax=Bosea sp. BK604 TaxID=2512180 RepID=UPI00104B136E|nr:zinc-binding dehydrogenase [Bosea sp. BK604]TCR64223.1 NADPH2:quinone reductase [Bosea sp. BK604]